VEAIEAQKTALRDQLVTARGRRSLLEVSEAARAIAAHLLATEEVRRAATVAAYVSIATEPGTGPLLELLAAAGKRVILPVLRPDNDLDWAVYRGRTT
jgi:5-formyltetrahydrofolate cyclo-ligase